MLVGDVDVVGRPAGPDRKEIGVRTVRRAAAMKALWMAVSGRRRPDGPSVATQLSATPRLVAMTMTGRYPGVTRGRLALMALAMLYVVSPVDLVPEAALLLLGMADDAMVLAWLAGALLAETDAFLAWEDGGPPRPPADPSQRVVRGDVLR
jgi:uncharacterized membrane protein YkvA (DUF1232 family)